MKPILEIKNISKKFRIRHEQGPYLNLRDSISSLFKRKIKTTEEEFWALRNISFDVYPGDSVGIIGKNGAGKSTLLKIISKITPPTEGKIISRGRIVSLLEVGTGFHPELTGRENIFLNGSILGMKRSEIQKKFDEIVDFSGVEKFLDTPLKHFSSGMQLRLAFSVAAFLEPEILVIDEVLAVGDVEFQKKCLGKMGEVSKGGRTLLFVSHQMGSVNQLCKKAVLLKKGIIDFLDTSEKTIAHYLDDNKNELRPAKKNNINQEKKELSFKEIYFTNEDNEQKIDFYHDENIFINFEIEGKNNSNFTLFVSIVNAFLNPVFTTETTINSNKITLKIHRDFLAHGTYTIRARIHIVNLKIEDITEDEYSFSVVDLNSAFVIYNSINYFYGSVMGNCQWLEQKI